MNDQRIKLLQTENERLKGNLKESLEAMSDLLVATVDDMLNNGYDLDEKESAARERCNAALGANEDITAKWALEVQS